MVTTQTQTCRHCQGTTFCGGPTQAACTSCKVESGLDANQEYKDVVCSVCHGTGLFMSPREPSGIGAYRAYNARLEQARLPGRLLGKFAFLAVVIGIVLLVFYGR